MMQRKHPSEAMTGATGALPGEAIRILTLIVAPQRLYPHPLHQRFDMPTADLAPLGSQQASQHPRAGEWKFQMQSVEPPHHLKVGRRHRTWQIVDSATADAQNGRLPCDR